MRSLTATSALVLLLAGARQAERIAAQQAAAK